MSGQAPMNDPIQALEHLRPYLTNVIGFYDLLYEPESELTPLQRLSYEAHFATSSRKIAVDLISIIKRFSDGERP